MNPTPHLDDTSNPGGNASSSAPPRARPFARALLATAVLFVVALLWNGVLHLGLLREANAAIASLRRPDLADRMGLSLLLTVLVVVLFVAGYRRFARRPGIAEGAAFGLYFGLVAGVLVDFNQFVVYPVPGSLAFAWCLGGLVELTAYGVLVAWIFPVPGPRELR